MKKISSTLIFSTLFLLSASIVSAQSVDLVYQGNGYVQPFYKGRDLWSQQSRITLLAIPQGLGNPANLNYRWSQNGTILGGISGAGKNSLSFDDTVLSKSQAIKVEVVTSDGEPLAESSAVITPVPPSILVYENNPLYGFLFHNEVSGTYPLREAEVNLAAFPLFFSAGSFIDPSLSYKWRTNTGETELDNPVTYRAPEGASGHASISINLDNPSKLAQTASKNFLIQFGTNE